MRIETLPVGMLAVNCYLVWDDNARETLIVDAGDEADRIIEAIRKLSIKPVGILQTHGHVDHILALRSLVDEFAIPVYVHPDEHALYYSPANSLLPWVPAARNLPKPADTPPQAAGLPYAVIHTPGHTPGGVCYHFADAAVLFSGDTLFHGSIGRTDLTGGDMNALLTSIRTKLLPLPANTTVYPGHGPTTTIGEEKEINPFVN
ncbi:MAG: hypothetical protein A3K19_28690 [Lentisphaerae bacterium RIFOXYB12_FULL_65_16]|nr:MAG: hypothetical protein A3K18_23975 [Lentisphaerae bacterium RIFOXYA12_64_32]OGV91481.1 MAG: hypothetical protein A3K19_28690 [Lentisphaerae bacterium RIFOXYB12_FULL_65_16]